MYAPPFSGRRMSAGRPGFSVAKSRLFRYNITEMEAMPMRNKHPDFRTSPKERVSYWTFFVGQNVFYNIIAMFLTTYLALQGVSLEKAATVLLLVKVWDAVNDPIFGFIFDRIHFKNGQKCLPWLRFVTAAIPVVTILLFAIPRGLSETAKLWWMGICYVLWDTAYTLTDVPVYSMLTTMTDNLAERTHLLSVNRIFSGAGVLIYGVVLNLLISEKVGMNATWSVAALSVFSVMTMVPLCVNCREHVRTTETPEESFTPRQMMRYLTSNKYLLIYYGGFFCTEALRTSNAVLLFASFYLFGNSTYSILLTALNLVPGVFAAMAMPRLMKKFDKFQVLFWCNIASVLLGFAIWMAGYGNTAFFLVMTVLRCIPTSVVSIMNYMFTPDCAEYGTFITGIEARGITFAIQTFATKLTTAVSSFLALFLLGLFQWVTVEAESFAELAQLGVTQSQTALTGLWMVYALVPALGMLASTFFYLFYKLNDRDVQIMSSCNSGQITRAEAEKQLSRKY